LTLTSLNTTRYHRIPSLYPPKRLIELPPRPGDLYCSNQGFIPAILEPFVSKKYPGSHPLKGVDQEGLCRMQNSTSGCLRQVHSNAGRSPAWFRFLKSIRCTPLHNLLNTMHTQGCVSLGWTRAPPPWMRRDV